MPITCTRFAVPSQNARHFSNRSSVIPFAQQSHITQKAQPGAVGAKETTCNFPSLGQPTNRGDCSSDLNLLKRPRY